MGTGYCAARRSKCQTTTRHTPNEPPSTTPDGTHINKPAPQAPPQPWPSRSHTIDTAPSSTTHTQGPPAQPPTPPEHRAQPPLNTLGPPSATTGGTRAKNHISKQSPAPAGHYATNHTHHSSSAPTTTPCRHPGGQGATGASTNSTCSTEPADTRRHKSRQEFKAQPPSHPSAHTTTSSPHRRYFSECLFAKTLRLLHRWCSLLPRASNSYMEASAGRLLEKDGALREVFFLFTTKGNAQAEMMDDYHLYVERTYFADQQALPQCPAPATGTKHQTTGHTHQGLRFEV